VVTPGDSVLMHHNHLNRDGVYVQPLLTKAAAAGLHLDTSFVISFVGEVYAQPLYVDNGPGGTDLVIVVTEEDVVYAFDASSGREVWHTSVGTPVSRASLPCGNIDPLGITGTPVIDLASRTLFVGAMTTPDAGLTKAYEIFALSIDDGSVRPGWPVDMASTVASGSTVFTPNVQGQRAALALVNGILYVPFGGLAGDCGDYHGWVVAIPIADPSDVQAWATPASGGGIWEPGGLASDGSNIYATTGNTIGVTAWGGGEAIIQFSASLPLSTAPAYWAPPNWLVLDAYDGDLSSAGPIVFDLPGATPSHLVVALGKGRIAFLEDANHLGGIAEPMAMILAASSTPAGAHLLYTTDTATYFVFQSSGEACNGLGNAGTDLTTLKIIPGSPPTFGSSWCTATGGRGSPILTTTDGRSDPIVWSVGAEGSNLLQGFNGDTGATIFAGGATPIAGARRYLVPIAAKGRIFVATDGTVVAFRP
jgi:outer membrane protein assembly factor BamB